MNIMLIKEYRAAKTHGIKGIIIDIADPILETIFNVIKSKMMLFQNLLTARQMNIEPIVAKRANNAVWYNLLSSR